MAKRLSRRTFLKVSGAAGLTLSAIPTLPKIAAMATSAVEKKPTLINSVCEMCTSRCPVQAKVVDDKVSTVGGNPNYAPNGGTVCARGAAGLGQLYDDQRLKKPLIRTGARGEGKWKEVSYEEAYDYIAQKMNQIKSQHGPEKVAFAARNGPHLAYFFNLAKAFGSPNTFTHESTCPLAREVALEATFGTAAVNIDYGNVKYLLSLGRNHFEGFHTSQVRGVTAAMEKGAKIVSVDPRFSIFSAKAHEWYPIRPGTDLALVLAIQHVLIRDNMIDKAFIDAYTSGFDAVKSAVAPYTPEWAEKETDIKAADIEKMAKELWAARPRGVIDWGWRTAFTPEEFELRRAIIITDMLLGTLDVPGGTFLRKTVGFINGMAGKELLTGMKGPKLPPYPKMAQRVDGANVKGNPHEMVPAAFGVVQQIPDAILSEKPYPIKGWFVYRYNPVCTQPDSAKVIEALKKLELLVVCEIQMSDTAMWADVVLPECTYLERDEAFLDYSGAAPQFTLRQQAVKPLFDTRPHWQIFKELGSKLGLDAYFPWKDMEEVRRIQLGGNEKTLAGAKEKGFFNFGMKPLFLRDKASVAEFVKQFPEMQALVNTQGFIDAPLTKLNTPSKKIELLSQNAERLFQRGVPIYRPVTLKKPGELYFVQGKTALHTNGHTHNNPWLFELFPASTLWINPKTAEKLGLIDGGKAEMTSSVGKQIVKILVSEGIRPDTVFAYFGFGRTSPDLKRAYHQGINSNMMMPVVNAPVAAANIQTTGVTLRKV